MYEEILSDHQLTATVRDFRKHLTDLERAPATAEKYQRDLRKLLRFAARKPLDRSLLCAFKAHIGAIQSPKGANSVLAAINAYLKFIGRADLVLKPFRIQKEICCPEEKELSKSEYLRLCAAARKQKKDRLALLIETVCGTGIRISELSYITVEAARSGKATVSCKGKMRVIFLVSILRKKLLRYAEKNGIASGVIFVTRKGSPMNRSNIWREMKALCTAANVAPTKVFPHNLRHLFARIFYALEKDVVRLADILGHSSINTTRIYLIHTGRELQKRLEAMHLIL